MGDDPKRLHEVVCEFVDAEDRLVERKNLEVTYIYERPDGTITIWVKDMV